MKKEFYSFDGSDSSLGDGGGNTSGEEVLSERNGIDWHPLGINRLSLETTHRYSRVSQSLLSNDFNLISVHMI